MTLKDFHGGSIPSDLPLPSAPGVSVRPSDRWGPSAIGIRPDSHHGQRPGSAGSGGGVRLGSGFGGVGERGPPFPSTPANIGRHFDEDERKPFDASAAFPRRPAPVPDPVSRPTPATLPVRSDPKPQGEAQPQARSGAGPTPNAWGLRREEVRPVVEPVVASPQVQASSAAVLSSRFAQASAIDKISSGRWQTKPITPPADVEVIRFHETVSVVDEVRASSPLQQEVKERVFHNERVSLPLQQEVKERGFYNEGVRPVSNEGRFGGGPQHQQQQRVGVDVAGERQKLKLLPRTRTMLMDANEIHASEEKQGHQPTVDPVHMENPRELQQSTNIPRPGSAGADAGGRVSERPKLNLKPRSLPVEQSDESTERERKSVFGGARPRELVLKERGIDDIASANLEVISPANRVKSDIPKTDTKPKLDSPTLATRHGENYPVEQRSRRDFERKDSRADQEKVDGPRASWRNDNWKNTGEIEKPVERCPEPDTWRKPVEEPKPEAHETTPQYGKAASALELAQAFSRSVSDTRPDNRVPNQRSAPGRVQVPFSRLTDTRDFYSGPNPRQINGY